MKEESFRLRILLALAFIYCTLIPLTSKAVAGEHTLTRINSVEVRERSVDLRCATDTTWLSLFVRVSFPNENIVRVRYGLSTLSELEGEEKGATFRHTEDAEEIVLTSGELKVRLLKQAWRIQIVRGNEILFDDSPIGTQSMKIENLDRGLTRLEQSFRVVSGEHFYGFGEQFSPLDKLGKRIRIWVSPAWKEGETSFPVPFFLSTRGYAFFLNSNSESEFDMGATNPQSWTVSVKSGEEKPTLDYYFFGYRDPKKSISEFTSLTGRVAKVPPRWVFGPWMSDNSMSTQRSVLYRVATTRALDIPATAIVVETWQAGMNRSWDHTLYPTPERFIDLLHERFNMRLILYDVPAMLYPHMPLYQEASRRGFLPKNPDGTDYFIADHYTEGASGSIPGWGTLIDFSNPAATDWWMNAIHGPLVELGVDGYKVDDGEVTYHPEDQQIPRFHNRMRGTEMHNYYPVLYNKAYYEFLSKRGGGIIFGRSGFTGAGAFPLHWAGDHYTTFPEYRSTVLSGLSAALSGIPFWSWDLAGIGGHPSDELYIRSAQMATFCPVMQYHHLAYGINASLPNDPWYFSDETREIYARYARLRMNLIPYILSASWQAVQLGLPLMRPMFLEYPDSPEAFLGRDFQYFFGDSFLVAPVMHDGVQSTTVHLPAGSWIDFWTNTEYRGPIEIAYKVPLAVLPVFVRNGGILPMELNPQFEIAGSMKAGARSVVLVYPSGNSELQWYADEPQQGHIIRVTCEDKRNVEGRLVLRADGHQEKSWTYRILTEPPHEVMAGKSPIKNVGSLENLENEMTSWFYSAAENFLYVSVDPNVAQEITVRY